MKRSEMLNVIRQAIEDCFQNPVVVPDRLPLAILDAIEANRMLPPKLSAPTEVQFNEAEAKQAGKEAGGYTHEQQYEVDIFVDGMKLQFERDRQAIGALEKKLKLEAFGNKVNQAMVDSCENELDSLREKLAEAEFIEKVYRMNREAIETLKEKLAAAEKEIEALKADYELSEKKRQEYLSRNLELMEKLERIEENKA